MKVSRISHLVSREPEQNEFVPKIKNFRDLEIWKLGKKIVERVYVICKSFPEDEKFGLVSQMKRAAVSIPSNIAEGFNRFHNREYRQFLFTALGSCAELETQIEISCDLRFCKKEDNNQLLEMLDHESKMLRSLINKL